LHLGPQLPLLSADEITHIPGRFVIRMFRAEPGSRQDMRMLSGQPAEAEGFQLMEDSA
jgi:hypothetical protein